MNSKKNDSEQNCLNSQNKQLPTLDTDDLFISIENYFDYSVSEHKNTCTNKILNIEKEVCETPLAEIKNNSSMKKHKVNMRNQFIYYNENCKPTVENNTCKNAGRNFFIQKTLRNNIFHKNKVLEVVSKVNDLKNSNQEQNINQNTCFNLSNKSHINVITDISSKFHKASAILTNKKHEPNKINNEQNDKIKNSYDNKTKTDKLKTIDNEHIGSNNVKSNFEDKTALYGIDEIESGCMDFTYQINSSFFFESNIVEERTIIENIGSLKNIKETNEIENINPQHKKDFNGGLNSIEMLQKDNNSHFSMGSDIILSPLIYNNDIEDIKNSFSDNLKLKHDIKILNMKKKSVHGKIYSCNNRNINSPKKLELSRINSMHYNERKESENVKSDLRERIEQYHNINNKLVNRIKNLTQRTIRNPKLNMPDNQNLKKSSLHYTKAKQFDEKFIYKKAKVLCSDSPNLNDLKTSLESNKKSTGSAKLEDIESQIIVSQNVLIEKEPETNIMIDVQKNDICSKKSISTKSTDKIINICIQRELSTQLTHQMKDQTNDSVSNSEGLFKDERRSDFENCVYTQTKLKNTDFLTLAQIKARLQNRMGIKDVLELGEYKFSNALCVLVFEIENVTFKNSLITVTDEGGSIQCCVNFETIEFYNIKVGDIIEISNFSLWKVEKIYINLVKRNIIGLY